MEHGKTNDIRSSRGLTISGDSTGEVDLNQLSRNEAADIFVAKRRLTLPPHGMPKFSSLFLILQNLYSYNQIPWCQFVAQYSKSVGQRVSRTLFEIGPWQGDLIASLSKISLSDIRQYAVFAPWVPIDNFSTAEASPFLRGCPTCFLGDFHTPLFQFSAVKKCPLHGDQLEDHCSRCGRQRPYSLDGIEKIPFSCQCSKKEWDAIRSVEFRNEWFAEMCCVLANYYSWALLVRTNISSTVSAAFPAQSDLQKSRYLLALHGDAIEQAVSASAALGIHVESPEFFNETTSIQTFSVSSYPEYPWTTVIEGVGAAGRLIGWHRMCGAFDNYVSELKLRTFKFIETTLDTAGLLVASRHSDCISKLSDLAPFCRQKYETICPAISALQFLRHRWSSGRVQKIWANYTREIERYYTNGSANVSAYQILSPHFFDLAVPAIVSELICHSFIRVVSFAADVAENGDCDPVKRFMNYEATTDLEEIPSFCLSANLEGTKLFCAVCGAYDWFKQWNSMTFVKGNHAQSVDASVIEWRLVRKRVAMAVDSMRSSKNET